MDWDILKLGGTLENNNQMRKVTTYIYSCGYNMGTWAYLLTPATANKILSKIYPILHPIDCTISTFDDHLFPMTDTSQRHDPRFQNLLKSYIINDPYIKIQSHSKTNKRIGIIGELSSLHNDSTSFT